MASREDRYEPQIVYVVPYNPIGWIIGRYIGALIRSPLRTIGKTIGIILFIDAIAIFGALGVAMYYPETRELLLSEASFCVQGKPCFNGVEFEKRMMANSIKNYGKSKSWIRPPF